MKIFIMLIFILNVVYSIDNSKDRIEILQDKFITTFQLCISMNAEYKDVNKFAIRNLELRDVTDKLGNLMLAPAASETKSFLVEAYKKDNNVLILTTQNPNNCTVTYTSDVALTVNSIEKNFMDTFKLLEVSKDKKGLQTIDTYILDGKNKSQNEIMKKGLIHIGKYKYKDNNVFSVSYSPPSSIKDIIPKNQYYECKDYPNRIWLYIINKGDTMDVVLPTNGQYDVKNFIKQGKKYCNKFSSEYCLSFENKRVTLINPYQNPISIFCNSMTEEELSLKLK